MEPILVAELVNAALNVLGRGIDVLLLFALNRLWRESRALAQVRERIEE